MRWRRRVARGNAARAGAAGSARRAARLALAAALASALLAPTPARAAEAASARDGADATWYAERITAGDTPLRVEHLWSKGRRLRSETVIGGFPVVSLVSGEFYYVLDPMRQTGLAVRRSPVALKAEQSRGGARPFGSEGRRLVEQGAEKVRSEKLAGRPCAVYRLTDRAGHREAWITDDALALPIRIEAFDRASGAEVRTDYVDWSRDLPIPDSFFEPDPRVRLERLEYEEYLKRVAEGPVGPAPILHSELFHGR